ncbi:MAG: T9SS type A sorting domain-containing protein [Ignavibacteriae bacterium]|nr:T9SS type A sorting domain-containing protein [Ignavibacteriota bacterium]
MLKKLLTISLMLLIASSFMFAQNRAVLKADGDLIKLKKANSLREALKTTKLTGLNGRSIDKNVILKGALEPQGTLDTLTYYDRNFGSNFGFFGQDVMFQYFLAPADLIINGAGFSCSDATGSANAQISVRLMKMNWTFEEFLSFGGDGTAVNMGYYPNSDGLGNIDPFGEDATGDWVDLTEGAAATPPWAHDDYDLWSDFGFGWPITAELQDEEGNYQWVDMSNLGFNPQVSAGEVFAVVITHDGTTLDGDRIGFYAESTIGVPGWKFYENGRFAPGDGIGWWAREFTWDFVVAVDLVGDRPPVINSFDRLTTTLSTEARTVTANITDDNPSGGAAGVASATLSYSLDEGTTWMDIAMTGTEPDFSAEIPGQAPGTTVWYKLNAVDVEGLPAQETLPHNYSIFEATQPNLVIFDGLSGAGYPSAYYFGQDDFDNFTTIDFAHDVWAYGAYDESLLNNYNNVFEIVTGGPGSYQRESLTNWMAADGSRNYFLAGEEWLGADNGYTDQAYAAGSFEYDVLGVAASYNDISYDGTSGQELPSLLFPVEGSALGGALYDLYVANGSTDSLLFDPIFEISAASNWMDGFDAVNPDNVDLMVETRGIAGAPAVETKAAAVHNVTAGGNKVAFMSLDPLSINSSPDYYWYGFSASSIQVMAGNWFEIAGFPLEVKQTSELVPNSYALDQNYPNPFNPSTVINYSIVKPSEVSLAVYDVLGRKVADLLNESQKAGSYQVTWNGLNNNGQKVNSGVYFYTITAGDFVQTRKMMLLK